MTFEGAVIREQGITFAIVVVKLHVVEDQSQATEAIAAFQSYFPGQPVVLMGQDTRGRATYFGRPDIVRFLAKVSIRAVPWRRYTVG